MNVLNIAFPITEATPSTEYVSETTRNSKSSRLSDDERAALIEEIKRKKELVRRTKSRGALSSGTVSERVFSPQLSDVENQPSFQKVASLGRMKSRQESSQSEKVAPIVRNKSEKRPSPRIIKAAQTTSTAATLLIHEKDREYFDKLKTTFKGRRRFRALLRSSLKAASSK
eukprot:c758_g1_i1.p1 GENE.c758_g1_i1~~c758_g1_i1.p1  ORF type:complete len:189 (+),score=37.31 c758_g1_i1:56-568(+)